MTATISQKRKPQKPLTPIQVDVAHVAYCQALGMGTIDIVADDGTVETYLLFAHRDGGNLVGVRLVKLSTAAQHDVDLTAQPWQCDCGDATHRPGRPGGCRHVAALRMAADELRKQA